MTQILEEIQREKDKPHCQNGRLQHFFPQQLIEKAGEKTSENLD